MRIRINYQKTEALRYTGNLDIQKIWERYLRRANLPVAYSQGFHPQPRIQQACPLPLGFLSQTEQVDIFLNTEDITPQAVHDQLLAASYPGITISHVEAVELSHPVLSTRVISAEYRAEFLEPIDSEFLEMQVSKLMSSVNLYRSRRGKQYDLRPLIEELALDKESQVNAPALVMRLAARQSATGRPEEVVSSLGYDPYAARYIRTRLIFLQG